MKALWVAGAFAGLLLAASGMAGERLTVAGTNISMEVPEGFVPAPNFSGFTNPETRSNIVFAHFEQSVYARLAAAFVSVEEANAVFSAQGTVYTEMSLLPTDDGGVLTVLRGVQDLGDVTVEKWTALSGPDDATAVTLGLHGGSDPDADAVRAALQSLTFGGPVSIEEQMAALPFAISTQPPFVVQQTLSGIAAWLFTVEEEDPAGLRPVIMLGWDVSTDEPVAHAAEIAEPLLHDTIGLEIAVIQEWEPASFAGLEGIRLAGSYQRDGVAMHFAQYLSVIEGKYVRLLATMKADEAEALMPVVEAIAMSVMPQ
jgi:hypothetical protein